MKKKIKLSPKIIRKLKKLKVGIVYLYGSQSIGAIHPLSDFDVGIVFTDPKMVKKAAYSHIKLGSYFDLLFEEIFPATFKNPVQTTFLQTTPLDLQINAIKDGVVLYKVSPKFQADYKEYVMSRYADIKPLLEEFYQGQTGVRYVKETTVK